MQFRAVEEKIRGVPFTSPERGRELYDYIIKHQPERSLELGFAHGVSTCYIAAALHENGKGVIDAVDLACSTRDPSAEDLLERCGLSKYADLHRERNSYTWYLKKLLETQTDVQGTCQPIYDFCFIDGPKNWTVDGAAFFMVDKLLKTNATILFDDYSYAYGSKEGITDGIMHRDLDDDERLEPHIEAIFRLLVLQHPDYGEFDVVNEQWAWARKTGGVRRTLKITENIGMREKVLRTFRRIRSKL